MTDNKLENIRTKDWRLFLELCDNKTASRIAKEHSQQTSSVSAQIKRLNQEMDKELFIKSSDGKFFATDEALRLRPYAETVLHACEEFSTHLHGQPNTLRFPDLSSYVHFDNDIYEALIQYVYLRNMNVFKAIPVNLSIEEAEQALLDGRIDFCVLDYFRHLDKLYTILLSETTPFVAVQSSHPLAAKSNMTFQDLQGYPLYFGIETKHYVKIINKEARKVIQPSSQHFSETRFFPILSSHYIHCVFFTLHNTPSLFPEQTVLIPVSGIPTYRLYFCALKKRMSDPLLQALVKSIKDSGKFPLLK